MRRILIAFAMAAAAIGTAPAADVVYEYDDLGRLVKVIYPNPGDTITYKYDAAGNITEVTVQATP